MVVGRGFVAKNAVVFGGGYVLDALTSFCVISPSLQYPSKDNGAPFSTSDPLFVDAPFSTSDPPPASSSICRRTASLKRSIEVRLSPMFRSSRSKSSCPVFRLMPIKMRRWRKSSRGTCKCIIVRGGCEWLGQARAEKERGIRCQV